MHKICITKEFRAIIKLNMKHKPIQIFFYLIIMQSFIIPATDGETWFIYSINFLQRFKIKIDKIKQISEIEEINERKEIYKRKEIK